MELEKQSDCRPTLLKGRHIGLMLGCAQKSKGLDPGFSDPEPRQATGTGRRRRRRLLLDWKPRIAQEEPYTLNIPKPSFLNPRPSESHLEELEVFCGSVFVFLFFFPGAPIHKDYDVLGSILSPPQPLLPNFHWVDAVVVWKLA